MEKVIESAAVVHQFVESFSNDEIQAARLTICGAAKDLEEAQMLLSMCGIAVNDIQILIR